MGARFLDECRAFASREDALQSVRLVPVHSHPVLQFDIDDALGKPALVFLGQLVEGVEVAFRAVDVAGRQGEIEQIIGEGPLGFYVCRTHAAVVCLALSE